MSDLPSPLKSPTWTSTQVTLGFQVAQRLVVKVFDPLESPTYHCPVCRYRPMISACPSPLKSPVWTSTQGTFGFQGVQRLFGEAEPGEAPIHPFPAAPNRPRKMLLARAQGTV